MSARPFDLSGTITRFWVDSSIQMMRATTDFWSGLLLPSASTRAMSSTASPWWMPPQASSPRASAALWSMPLVAGSWMSPWSQALSIPTATMPGASPFLPWLPAARSPSASNPFALWQQIWLDAAAPATRHPWPAATPPVAEAMWQPIATAYRTANGHAMAAVLRTMADVVEPKSQDFSPAQYWPSTHGARH